ncbi:MAG: hypothetical protein ACTH2Q_19180 [Propionibacteriaceae bacterium]
MRQQTRSRTWLAHLALVLVGIVIILFPFTFGSEPNLNCRGVPMNPGDTCTKADGEALETYEDRVEKANDAKPIVVVVGLVVAGFGGVLLYGARRKDPVTHP